MLNKVTLDNYKKSLILDWLEEECLKLNLSPIYLDYDLVHKLLVNVGGMTETEFIQTLNQWLEDEMNHKVAYHDYSSEIRLNNLVNTIKAITYLEQPVRYR